MICPNCKIIISEPVEYCLKCHFPINTNEQTEGFTKEERLKEMLICPKCGALHTPTAKVCRNDGTPLSKYKDIKVDIFEEEKKGKRNPNKKILLSFFALISLFTLFYIYASGRIVKDFKKETYEKDVVLESKKDDKILSEKEKTPSNSALIEVEINRKLRKNGVEGIYVEVGEDFTATITGYFLTKIDRLKTFNIIESYKDISSIVDSTNKVSKKRGVSAFSLKNKINESLKNEGLDNLIVEIDEYMNVTIKGAVKGKEEKNKAFEIAKSFKDVKNVRDLIFIVEH